MPFGDTNQFGGFRFDGKRHSHAFFGCELAGVSGLNGPLTKRQNGSLLNQSHRCALVLLSNSNSTLPVLLTSSELVDSTLRAQTSGGVIVEVRWPPATLGIPIIQIVIVVAVVAIVAVAVC